MQRINLPLTLGLTARIALAHLQLRVLRPGGHRRRVAPGSCPDLLTLRLAGWQLAAPAGAGRKS